MAGLSSLAYVIKTMDYRETSLLATFYTREFGKLKAVIKGGRDGRAKMGSTFETFSLNEIMVYKRKRGDLHLVTQGDLLERFNNIRDDLFKLPYATYYMELIDQMTEGEAHPEIYQLISDALNYLKHTSDPQMGSRYFEIKLMHALGFMPELNQCTRCEQVDPKEFYFSVDSGGIVCGSCRKDAGPLMQISRGALEFLNQARKRTFTELRMLKAPTETALSVEKLMLRFLEMHWDYRPKSLIFMDKMKLSTPKMNQIMDRVN